MKILRYAAGCNNERERRSRWVGAAMLPGIATVLALAGCSQQPAPAPSATAAAPAATAAAPNAPAAGPGRKTWIGSYEIDFATDVGSVPGGGAVIWNSDPNAANQVDLQPAHFNLGDLETYECASTTNAQPAWQNCLFIRVGTEPLDRPVVPGHSWPTKPFDKKNPSQIRDEFGAIAVATLTGMIHADTERLVGSFVKDGKIEYLVLYRFVDGISDGKASHDLLVIDLKDPKVAATLAENGWGTGGKK